MSNEQDNQQDDALGRATDALRNIAPPGEPSAELLASTLGRMQAAGVAQTRSGRWRVASMNTLLRIAASALLVGALAGTAVYLASEWGTSMAFADVLKQVRELRSVQFKTTSTIAAPGQPAQTVVSDVILAEPARKRQTIQVSPETNVISILDLEAKKMLVLYPEQKLAELTEISNLPAGGEPLSILETMRALGDADGTPAGEKVINGKNTKGFKVVTQDGQEMTLWIDTDTRLPVQVDLQNQIGTLPPTSNTLTDFKWEQTVDESLFSLTPPAGYEVVSRQLDMKTGTLVGKEQDLIGALKRMAELNGGIYADGFDEASLMNVLAKSREPLLSGKLSDSSSPEWKELLSRQVQTMSAFHRGSAFVADSRYGSDWHYAGMNVEVGRAGVPIFWYRPAGSQTYRVIDADLKVHDTVPSDLPNVPSIAVVTPATQPMAQ